MKTPLVSLALIVGPNEGDILKRLIHSARDLWDEVIVVAAVGNNDAYSVRICAQEAAGEALVWGEYQNSPEHKDWPHIDNFAAARNQAFNLAKGKYVIWADCDDLFDGDQAKIHRHVIEEREKADKGWDILVTRYDVQNSGMRHNRRERIFRRQADGFLPAVWERSIHERVKPIPNMEVGLADGLVIVHAPNNCKKNSSDRNKRILNSVLEGAGMNWYYIGMESFLRNDYQAAIGPVLLALEHPDLGISERYQLLCMAGVMCADPAKRRKYLGEAVMIQPTRREAYGHYATQLMDDGNYHEAVRLLQMIMTLTPPAGVVWNLDAKWYGNMPNFLLEQSLRVVGQTADADRCLKEAFRAAWGQITIIYHGDLPDVVRTSKLMMDTSDQPAGLQHLFITNPGEDKFAKRLNICTGVEDAISKTLGRILLHIKCGKDLIVPALRWDMDLLAQGTLPAGSTRLPDPIDRAGNVIVGLTTTPTRIGKIMPTIQSLLAQSRPADQIILSVPEKLARTGERFGDIPKEILELAETGKLQIHRTKDYGPATKFIGPLEVGGDPDDKICWLDDDILYSPLLLQTLAEELDTRPKTALGVCGFFMTGATGYAIAPDHGGHAEILEGFGGVMCRRSDMPKADLWPAIPASEFSGLSPVARAKFLADDYMMSTELRKAGTATLVCNTPELNRGNSLKIRPEGLGADALQNNKGTGGNLAAYALLKANG
jgi:hypothetical protein